jgi:hypothetical protein
VVSHDTIVVVVWIYESYIVYSTVYPSLDEDMGLYVIQCWKMRHYRGSQCIIVDRVLAGRGYQLLIQMENAQ